MDSNLESVARTRKKQDPAWNHCEKIKDGARVELKCIYCGKVFKGGGIYRFKEHLAGQKGNGATCSKVHPDIRLQMLEVLIGSSSKKKKKKPKLAAEMAAYGDSTITGTEVANNGSGLNVDENVHVPVYDISGFEVANNTCGFDSEGNAHVSPYNIPPLSEVEVAKSNCYLNSHGIMDASGDREDGMSGKKSARKKKGRVTKTLNVDVVDLNIEVPPGYPALNSKKKVSVVDMAIGRFFFDVGLPADAVNSAYFQPMLDAIASQGAGVVGPSYYDLRSWILKNSVHEVRYDVEQCTSAWGRTGCSILVYEWSSKKCKTFINLFAYSPEGTIFLRSADISHAIDAADFLYELLKETVEQVGLNNVVQVVTTGEERYVIAGKRLTDTYPTIFWTPCAGYCIDLMLQDIGELPEVKMILNQAKSISSYIYSDTATINMIRRYTSGVDLVDLGTTRSSTDFMTLKRMLNVRQNLQSMVTSEEWMGSYCSEKAEGIAVLDSVCSQSFWSTCASVVRLTDPILHLLKLVDSQKMPSMGFVYAGLYRVKEAIKKELLDSGDYLVYWSIIDHRWEQLERHPLHAAGFYLNPKHFNSLEEDGHHHIRSLVFDCIEKLVTDPNIQDKIMRERASYLSCKGDFGRKMAIRSRDTILPTEWWLTYGGECPNLARLAIRILSQTCCLIQHKLDKVSLERLHERKNWLEHQRLSDLAYVQHNMSLKHMGSGDGQQKSFDPLSYEHVDLVEDWVIGNEFFSEGSGKKGWMDVEPPHGNVMPSGPQINDFEALGAGFDDYKVFYGVKYNEEENGDENIRNSGANTTFPDSDVTGKRNGSSIANSQYDTLVRRIPEDERYDE